MSLPQRRRPLGTMVAHGFAPGLLEFDLGIAVRLGATLVEVLPEWRAWPDPGELRTKVSAAGLGVHSVHGCWGGQSVQAARVDLGSTDAATHAGSVADLQRCLDWTCAAGGRFLVVHPGGLSPPAARDSRRDALARGLLALADHARGTDVAVCVENMPPGVHPGSGMDELAALLAEIDQPGVGLTIDTGHAHMTTTAALETRVAGARLRTTHVHDNNGRQDVHLPPGEGTVDWPAWADALDDIGYHGAIMLECIRLLRHHPESLSAAFLVLLDRLTTVSGPRERRS
jgi:sugar phosphate isomerase/epimerase